ncbi:uncharacterized protein LOC127008631 [Eriocheir sinensis]|uniref:uncharacterized protein LOC127008631 n=1 Tax=Eriocheir sinensis TaxID=95602 RepID=UPI0021C9424B|nr:uncharacterized protein LOC127008631 [Eriocheir sinensis]
METDTINLILCVLPEHLKEKGSKLIEICKIREEERLRERSYKYGGGRGRGHSRERNSVDAQAKIKEKVEATAVPLAIARLVMELWSSRMRKHAENLILQKAIEEGYLEENLLKWVHALEHKEEEEEAKPDEEWLIDNQDEAIIKLVWDVFNIKEHYSQVKSHRSWVLKSYYRLKDFLPSLQEEIMQRHDLSKYAFSQAIGYTLKWVHNTYHEIWKEACDFHLFNEPHHPQAWSKKNTPEEKHNKLRRWLSGASNFHTGCPYGLDIANLDLSTEDFAEPFLLESYVDMVGVEWERKKGQDENILTRELAYIDDKFLSRYTKKQHLVISNLIERIIASDTSWKNIPLTEREQAIMSTVPPPKQGTFATQVQIQKQKEESRFVKLGDASTDGTSALSKEVLDNSFFIMLCKAVIEFWDGRLRKRAEHLILKKAIEEKQIKSDHVDWILAFEEKDYKAESSSSRDACVSIISDDAIVKLLWDEFQLSNHFIQVQRHRYWIKQSYLRLARFMPELSDEVIERHDLTKLSLTQSLGYTLKWVHNISYPVWRRACDSHLNCEPHHPQMWSIKNTPEHKKNCLESWLGGRDSYGVVVSTLDLGSENMARVFLLESLIDMVAVEWERNKDEKPDLSYTQLISMEDRFLSRYTPQDKAFVVQLMETIRMADHK